MRNSSGAGTVPTIVGIVVLLAFGFFITYLIRHLADSEQQWSRLIYLFGGVEAIAFAAAGFLFGKEVNRERATKAEDRATEAERKASNVQGDKRAAEERLANLVTVIDEKQKRQSRQSSLSDLLDRHLGEGPNAKINKDHLIAFLQSKNISQTAVQSDPEWEELADIAKRFKAGS